MIWEVKEELTSATIFPLEDIIESRGHDYQEFMNPDFKQLHDPLLMKNMEAAAQLTVQAIQDGWKIRIFGDYDADGISSTKSIVTLLRKCGAIVDYDIPNRSEGYGFNKNMIDKARQEGIKLIITCDNGITAIEQTEYAKSLGISVIITDHHEPQDVIPNTIVVNPMQKDCSYPFKKLAGAAVAWKFATAVCMIMLGKNQGWLAALDIIEIPAIGTVADVMELVGENRVIVTFGLAKMNKTPIIGLQELLKALDLTDTDKSGKKTIKNITAQHIGYTVGPALNASGRLVSAKEAVDMLLEGSRLKASRAAAYLAELNKERKELTEKFSTEIMEHLKDSTSKVIVHVNPEIPEGIIGIVASRIKEKLNRPVILLSYDETGTMLKGSGRSVPGYNLFENLMRHKDLFVSVGGHEMACGCSLEPVKVAELAISLQQECTLSDQDVESKLIVDYAVEPHMINMSLAESLSKLEPYGKGNAKPKFMLTALRVVSHKLIGKKGQHLKLELATTTHVFDCIGFNMAQQFKEIEIHFPEDKAVYLDIAFYPGINEWNGRRSLQLELDAIRGNY